MSRFTDVSLKIGNYKCFGEQPQGFDRILPINLLIGQNNSGKTALLDSLELAVSNTQVPPTRWNKKRPSFVLVEYPLSENVLRATFAVGNGGDGVPGPNHWAFGENLIGSPLSRRIMNGAPEFYSGSDLWDQIKEPAASQLRKNIINYAKSPFEGVEVVRVAADRDIRPEADHPTVHIHSDGSGFTNWVQHHVHKRGKPHELIQEELLRQLNSVFGPRTEFTSIALEQDQDSGRWEIVLTERGKGRIPVSDGGSGLKTTLLVLGQLVRVLGSTSSPGAFVFVFEELENNLHPAMQRRLFSHIRQLAVTRGLVVFISTHSSVAIDLFARDTQAQIIHVRPENNTTVAVPVQTYDSARSILDDLDVRASDLLQSNGVVWVEGPSDRVYVNRWIHNIDPNLKEGVHYQCMFYGGRLLAHLSADAPGSDEDRIEILRLNRNALILIDSDKSDSGAAINATKERIAKEIEGLGGFAWITAGREVENYLPTLLIKEALEIANLPELPQFTKLPDHLEANKLPKEAKRFENDKVAFAESAAPKVMREHMAATLDLMKQTERVVEHIRRWNRLSVEPVV